MATSPTPYETLLADNLRQLRQQQDLTQEAVANRMRAYGFGEWMQVTVAAIEAGRRHVSIGELLFLQQALQRPLAVLLDAARHDVAIPGGPSLVPRKEWGQLIKGAVDLEVQIVAHVMRSMVDTLDAVSELDARRGREHRRLVTSYPNIGAQEYFAAVTDARRVAERRLARRLTTELAQPVDSLEVAIAAYSLWHQGLSDVRDRRLTEVPPRPGRSKDSRRMQAAWITRTLGAELQAHIVAVRKVGPQPARVAAVHQAGQVVRRASQRIRQKPGRKKQ